MLKEKIIKLLKENSLGKRTAVIDTLNLGVYIYRKNLFVIKNFEDKVFDTLSTEEQEQILFCIETKLFEISDSYQG